MRKIYHNYLTRPVVKAEKLSRVDKVERAGYIPLERRIKDMMACGVRLQKARAEAYDIPEGSKVNEDEVQCDPTRSPGFDMADASAMADDLTARRKRARAEKKASEVRKTPAGQSEGEVKQAEAVDGGKTLEKAESGAEKKDK